MSGYVTIDNITIPVTNISLDPQLMRPVSQIVGASGSHTSYQGNGGRLLEISAFANDSQYPKIDTLWKKGKRVPLISNSKAKYNGFYHIIDFKPVEYKKGRFTITIKLQEDFTFNVTRKNFIDYNIKIKDSKVQMKVGDKWTTDS